MNRRFFILSFLLIFIISACQGDQTAVSQSTAAPAQTAVSTPLPPTQTIAPTVTSTSTATTTPSPTPIPPDLSIVSEQINLYPVSKIFAGDRVTFQISPFVPEMLNPADVSVHVYVDNALIAEGALSRSNLAQTPSTLFQWAWDTVTLTGEHTISIVLDEADSLQLGDERPENNRTDFPIVILPADKQPASEANATWISTETNCCIIYAVTGTAAYRDLPELLPQVETAVSQAADRLDETPNGKLKLYFADRVIGQGGYASSVMVVSYLDRQYAGNGLHELLVHEATHILDRQFAPRRITFLAEGMAVWVSGGHYKPQDLNRRSAALLASRNYVPLTDLINNFYPVQHEIGYLQAAGVVTYLIDNYGYQRFRDFYAAVNTEGGLTPAESVNENLQIYYGQTLEEFEREWTDYLISLEPTADEIADLETAVRYYNIMRRYQIAHDPTAHFLQAWLPFPQAVQENGNPADLTRNPNSEINIVLETMLEAADSAWRSADYGRSHLLLDSVERVLDMAGVVVDPLASSYLDIIQTTAENGYEAQQIQLEGNRADVLATRPNGTVLISLDFVLTNQDWILSN